MSATTWAIGGALAAGAAIWVIGRRTAPRLRARERLYFEPSAPREESQRITIEAGREEGGGLGRWMALAGFESRAAPGVFLMATVCGTLLGSFVGLGVWLSGIVQWATRGLADLPGGFGAVFVPVAASAPFVLLAFLGLAPYLYVSAARKERVAAVEKDLPLTLELLATLTQAGLAFDAALARILEAQPPDRPLFIELRNYERDLQAGVPRVQALRRIARRLDVTPVTVVTSALVQAQQLGTGLADTLRRQSEDLAGRRRDALRIKAEVLPVKLVFPLVICFMPGLFVFTLGPAFAQLFQVTDSIAGTGTSGF